MNWLRFLRRAGRGAQLTDELEFHLRAELEDNIARGMSAEAARLAAHRKLGNPALIREEIYFMDTAPFVETLWRDIRYSLRTLRKNPVFAATAILTLALGIGGNTAIFTVIHAVLLKPLEYHDPDRLVFLALNNSKQNAPYMPFSLLRCEETRKTARSYTDVGSFLRTPENVTLSGGGDPEALKAARVSANFLDILGIQPQAGRSFLEEEDTPAGRPVAMISAGLWRRRFAGDPRIAGTTTTIDSTPYTIIGVLPEAFAFPFLGMDIWLTKPSEWSFLRPGWWKSTTTQIAFARLRPQVTLEQARAEMEVLNRQYAGAHPERLDAKTGITVRVELLKDRIVGNVRPMLWILFGAVGFVLLIACANLASLLLARAASRSREFAVRAALGAGRGRLVRQLLAESLLLAIAGGALGVLLAKWSLALLLRISALPLPRAGGIHVDGVVLAFTVALSMATGVLFGLFPSLQVSRPDLADVLRESGAAAGRATSGHRSLLVVGQVALSIVLLIGAALLIQSFGRLRHVDPGFQPANLLTMKIPLPPPRYDTVPKRVAFFAQLEQRVVALPGVRGAGIAMSIPTTSWLFTNVDVEGQPKLDDREQPTVQLQSITPDYFRAMRIPLRRGREFTARDNSSGAPPAIIINESFARRFWPTYPAGLSPVGQHMGEGADRIRSAEIVGIVADVREGGLVRQPGPEFYVPLALHVPQAAYLVVQTTGNPVQLAHAIRNEVRAIDQDQSVSDIQTMEEIFDATVGQKRLTMLLLAVFSGIALLLALVGLYGVIAYSVAQRTQEVGIRRALGAGQSDILRLVLSQALRLTCAGVVIGIGGAFAFTRVMKTLLFEIGATDPATFIWVAVVFVAVALAASFAPAWRALRIDPMAALRVG